MKSLTTLAALAVACSMCAAAERGVSQQDEYFNVERLPFGSGTPAPATSSGAQPAYYVVDGLYHVPNYLPGFPTAATIWPREVPIACEPDAETGKPTCTGYRVQPAIGRGEYIFVRPVAKAVVVPPPAPVIEVREICRCCQCDVPRPKRVPVTRKKPLG